MAHKEPRVECKIYLRPEERDHLKEVAKENEVSLSDLIGRTVLKKYPLPKKKKSTAAEPQSPTPEDIKQLEKRLVEVKGMARDRKTWGYAWQALRSIECLCQNERVWLYL